MASPSPCSVFIYYPLIITCLTTTCFSKSSIVFQLTHSLSNSPLLFFNSSHHLLKSTTTHSSHRFLNHHRQVSIALSPGSDYTMSFSLGASHLPVTLYMDTGSDLVWVPCKPFTCIMCEGKSDPQTTPLPHDIHVNSSSASPVTCQSRACSSVHSKIPSSHLCAMSRCPLDSIEMSECQNYTCPSFYYAYGILRDKIICNLDKTLKLSQQSPQNCPKYRHPVDGHYCQGCALPRKKFKEDLFTPGMEHGILQDSFEPSNDITNVASAPREPFVVNQNPDKNSSQNPPQINHHCCYGCGDPFEDPADLIYSGAQDQVVQERGGAHVALRKEEWCELSLHIKKRK
nr:probable aspartyl protease At4g16563 [Tanacetum cinerariifolium]